MTSISSFELIKRLVRDGLGISFVYESVARSDPNLHIFSLEGQDVLREFNIVYLQDAPVEEAIALLGV